MKRLYVGNLPYDRCTDEGLRALFNGLAVESTHVISDRETSRPKGFCFVEMQTPEAAQAAITQLDGLDFGGRAVTVRLAHEKPQKPRFEDRPRGRGGNGRRQRDDDRGDW